MKKIVFFIFILTSFFSKAQNYNKSIDSLLKIIKKKNAVEQFQIYLLVSDEYSKSDLDKAKYYSHKALKKASDIKSDSLIALSYNNIGNIHQYKSELDSALFFHKKTLQLRQTIKDPIGLADTYNNIGIVYETKGQYLDALKYYFKSLYFYEKIEDISKQAMVNTNIGIVYKAHKEYNKALYFYKKSYELYQKTNIAFGQTSSAGNLGSILINFKRYQESIKFSEIAQKGYKKNGYTQYEAYPISNIACALDSLHQFTLANKKYEEAIFLFEKYKNIYEVAEILNTYAFCLLKQKRFKESILQSKKALIFATKADAMELKTQSYKNLWQAYSKNKKFELANTYANLYNSCKDSLFANEKTKVIFELETKYQTAKKEKLLVKKNAEAKQNKILLISMSILAFLLALIGVLIYRQQKQKNKQMEQEFELKTVIAKIEMQNKLQDQRLRISRDLHDNIGSQLTFIISSVDNIKYAFDISNQKLETKLTNISVFAKETILELRDTIWAMNANEISFEDLENRIRSYIEKAKVATNEINFSFTIEVCLVRHKFTSVQGMNIYRVIQEAINNTLKYANATDILIKINKKEDLIKISIQDNGSGFDLETIDKGNGLLNMQKRMEEIGGNLTINSTNVGTVIDAEFKNNVL